MDILKYFVRKHTIDIPFSFIDKLDQDNNINILKSFLSNYIDEEKIDYPYEKYITNPYKLSYFIPTFKIKSGVIMFVGKSNNIYSLDIITDYFTQYARIKDDINMYYDSREDIINKAIDLSIKDEDNLNMSLLADVTNNIIFTKDSPNLSFSVSLVRLICNKYCKEDGLLFDPFSEWGDRAIGAALSSTVSQYIGIDINKYLIDGYEDIKEFIKYIRPEKTINFHIANSKEIDPFIITDDTLIDLIFTSPPYYFDIEDQRDWLDNTIIPITTKLWKWLRIRGNLVYYIFDNTPLFIDRMIEIYGKPFYTHRYSRDKILSSGSFYIWRKLNKGF